MARVALVFAYDGSRFDSFARQPRQRTVEGELVALLQRSGAVKDARRARFAVASRTDKGVSAAHNVAAFDSDLPPPAVAALSVRAPDGLHLLSAIRAADGFDPRLARRRVYRYLLPAPWSWRRVGPVARRFEGEHDFSNFRRADEGRSPVARLDRIRYIPKAPGPLLEFEAPYFLWQQVRRIVAALWQVEKGSQGAATVLGALRDPMPRADFGVAPPEELMLVRVDYPTVRFPAPPNVVRKRLLAEAAAARRRTAWATATLGNAPTVRR